MKAHVLAMGASQWGKTYTHNQVHRRWPDGGASIFVNTNEQPIWGVQTRSLGNLAQLVTRAGGHINWIPPEDTEAREAQLYAAVKKLARVAQGSRKQWSQPWCKITIDEATGYDQKPGSAMHFLATRGLGAYGMSLTAICQNPTPLSTEIRTNLNTRTVHFPGDEGKSFMQSKGYPADAIEAWTRKLRMDGTPAYNWCLYARGQWYRVRGRS